MSQSNDKYYSAKVAFLVDITGSMERSIQAVHELIRRIAEDTIRNFPEIRPEFAFVGYRDYKDDVPFVEAPFTPPHRVEEDFATVVESERCQASGGGDEAEDVLGGMEYALKNLDWSDARVKLLIHVADAPHHGSQFHDGDVGDDYPHRADKPRLFTKILRDYATQKIDYYFFQVANRNNKFSTRKMATMFQEEYNRCQSRRKNFTIYEFQKDFPVDVFFNRVMEGVSQSVLLFVKKYQKSGSPRSESEHDHTMEGLLNDFKDAAKSSSVVSVSAVAVEERREKKGSFFAVAEPVASHSTTKKGSFTGFGSIASVVLHEKGESTSSSSSIPHETEKKGSFAGFGSIDSRASAPVSSTSVKPHDTAVLKKSSFSGFGSVGTATPENRRASTEKKSSFTGFGSSDTLGNR